MMEVRVRKTYAPASLFSYMLNNPMGEIWIFIAVIYGQVVTFMAVAPDDGSKCKQNIWAFIFMYYYIIFGELN